MTTTLPTGGTRSVELTGRECLDRLGSTTTGRVAVVAEGRPAVVTVTHVYDPQLGRIVFPVDVCTHQASWYSWPWAAFETDGRDRDGTPWLIVATGELLELEYRDDIERLCVGWPDRAPFDGTTRWMSLSTDHLSGGRGT